MPLLAAKVDDATKAAFGELARRQGLNESDLIRRLAAQALGNTAVPPPARTAGRRSNRQVKLRLWDDELEAVERLAAADARSVPAWIVALVRSTALKSPAFNPLELQTLRDVIHILGPLSRYLHANADELRHSCAAAQSARDLDALEAAVSDLRRLVLELVDRASNRYCATTAEPGRPAFIKDDEHDPRESPA